MEIRDIWPDTLVELGRISKWHPLILLMKYIEQRVYKRADRIISLLPAADKYLIDCGVKPENILWLPNSVDTESMPAEFAPVHNEKFTVMYAGAHGLANDLDTVLEAAKLLEKKGLADRIRISLVGDGPDKARLQERTRNENIRMVEFYDAVPKNKIYAELNKADAYLMLLKNSPIFRWGISPNKLFDYFAMGRPVIFGVETPFNPVDTYQAGISITPSDAGSLAAAIEKLSVTSKDELQQMGARGKEFVFKKHNIAYLAASLESMLGEVIRGEALQHSPDSL